MYVILDDLVLSLDVPVKRRLSINILDDLNAKYVTLLEELKKIQKEKETLSC